MSETKATSTTMFNAAPDMLHALYAIRSIANQMSWDSKTREFAKRIDDYASAAIAKAESRGESGSAGK